MNDQEFENLIAGRLKRSFQNAKPRKNLLNNVFEMQQKQPRFIGIVRQYLSIRVISAAAVVAVLAIAFISDYNSKNDLYAQFSQSNAFFPDIPSEQAFIDQDFNASKDSMATDQELNSVKNIYDQNAF